MDTHNINTALLTAFKKMDINEIKSVKLNAYKDKAFIEFNDETGRVIKMSLFTYPELRKTSWREPQCLDRESEVE
tara:strand:+ start:168 stop:392 length:225 start_codon:yes stop_codon:yes gene_type:complete